MGSPRNNTLQQYHSSQCQMEAEPLCTVQQNTNVSHCDAVQEDPVAVMTCPSHDGSACPSVSSDSSESRNLEHVQADTPKSQASATSRKSSSFGSESFESFDG